MAVITALACLATYLLTSTVLRWAIRHSRLDIPNDRSSHSAPTPRGGGLAIVLVAVIALLLVHLLGSLSTRDSIGLIGGSLAVAGVGWLDDRSSLSRLLRLGAHALAAAWAIYFLGGLEDVTLFGRVFRMGVAGNVFAILVIVWATNLYNFMDGIDGIASIEAVTVSGLAAILFWLEGGGDLVAICLVIMGVSGGFIRWNWAPARIFMGDVGSGFLGFVFGWLAIKGEKDHPGSMVWVALLAGVFVIDATLTLFRRAMRRETIHSAHRSHAYQRIARAGYSHSQVSGGILVLNLVLGLFGVVGIRHLAAPWATAAAGLSLLLIVYLWIERRNPM